MGSAGRGSGGGGEDDGARGSGYGVGVSFARVGVEGKGVRSGGREGLAGG